MNIKVNLSYRILSQVEDKVTIVYMVNNKIHSIIAYTL
jgi:hypothetical protein